jgi:GTP-binding protein
MFIDEIKVYARAGHGGKGCVSFRREAHVPKGGPNGGNGGGGGSVILEASHDINNLIAQFYEPRLMAKNGEHGKGKDMDGRSGKDLIIKVPCGTLVWRVPPEPETIEEELARDNFVEGDEEDEEAEDFEGGFEGGDEEEDELEEAAPDIDAYEDGTVVRGEGGAVALEIDLSGEEAVEDEASGEGGQGSRGGSKLPENRELVIDMTEHGQRFVLCAGGRGGLGNRNFTTARRQAPRFAQPGEPGEEGEYWFELRIMADIGLVGYPNAGKSTLLTAVSKARPKVAPYPFTTLHPQMGVMEFEDYTRLTVCDVPGIIEGAHMNVGLGHEFLRHISRCKALVVLLDMAGADGREPWDDYEQLLSELRLYDPALLDRPRFVAANKMDEDPAPENLAEFRKKYPDLKIHEMSAAFDVGTEEFKLIARKAVERAVV